MDFFCELLNELNKVALVPVRFDVKNKVLVLYPPHAVHYLAPHIFIKEDAYELYQFLSHRVIVTTQTHYRIPEQYSEYKYFESLFHPVTPL